MVPTPSRAPVKQIGSCRYMGVVWDSEHEDTGDIEGLQGVDT